MKEVFLSNYLRTQYDKHSRAALLRSIYAGGLIICTFLLMVVSPIASLGTFLIGVGFMVMAAKSIESKRSFAVGMQGENTLREYLRPLLSDKYTAFYNVPTGYGDIDCVVAGTTGIYALEVKNHKGLIRFRDGKWSQVKIGAGGTAYNGSLKNPSNQLVGGIMRLKEYFVSQGINAWINGCVVFTHPEMRLSVEGLRNVKAVQINEINQVFSGGADIQDDALERIGVAIHKIRDG